MEYESPSQDPNLSLDQRLKILYPMVNEEETPLPRSWNTKDKYNYIGLSQSNLRVHYKGHGKTHKDASSVRATHPIPASCGLYYFEVKIVSKGRDGYMGVGLSAQGVNMNRLPGWDKNSYGYHGDDGHSFRSSGTGQQYGPTFTTGDVIGCGINLVDGSCFYTKNGHHLGIAFKDLPSQLYPTVGLQTPGEVIDANFGQEPFKFDVEGEMRELRRKTQGVIEELAWPRRHGEAQGVLHHMVATYLVHHGYSSTAETFARSAGQEIQEELASMRNRQHIQRLVLGGRIGEAVQTVEDLYPGLLHNNMELQFKLKVRQFIEMVAGVDYVEDGAAMYGSRGQGGDSSDDMEEQLDNQEHRSVANGKSLSTTNGNVARAEDDATADVMETESGGGGGGVQPAARPPSILTNPARFEAIITFGRGLQLFYSQLEQSQGRNDGHTTALQEAFSLLAYSDPWASPVGVQLHASGRETVCAALNSAILESKNLPGRPPLEISLAHSAQLLKLMSHSELGACAFADIQSIFN